MFSSCRGDVYCFGLFGGSKAGLVHSEVVGDDSAHWEVILADSLYSEVVELDRLIHKLHVLVRLMGVGVS